MADYSLAYTGEEIDEALESALAVKSVEGIVKMEGGEPTAADFDDEPTADSDNLITSGTVKEAVDDAEQNAKDYADGLLPAVINDRYLHTNATTGEFEWVKVQGGGAASYYSASVPITGWTQDQAANWYTNTISVTGILSTDIPDVDVDLSSAADSDDIEAMLTAWQNIFRVTTANGSITVYAGTVPETAITLQLRCIR